VPHAALVVDAVPPRGTERVLVVEDDLAVRAVVRRVLTSAGYTVLEAGHGDEALRRWRQERDRGAAIDIVITDAVMPELGGHALAERLRREWPGARIVLMSGYTTEAEGDPARARGHASAFLQKPLAPQALLRTVREVLDAPASEDRER
jgi:CheY-like chemotaxis protein